MSYCEKGIDTIHHKGHFPSKPHFYDIFMVLKPL